MKFKTASVGFTVIFILCWGLSLCFGQSFKSKPILWSPPDKSFSIVVPIKLKEDRETYKDAVDNTESEDGYTSIQVFGTKKADFTFFVYVLNLTRNQQKKSLEEKFGGLEFVLGGDDDSQFEERFIKIDGFSAKEIVYKRQNVKGLMIDTGDRIIVLGVDVRNRKNLESVVAKRFFISFRLTKVK